MTTRDLALLNPAGPSAGSPAQGRGRGGQEARQFPGPDEIVRSPLTSTGAHEGAREETNSEQYRFLDPPQDPGELGWLGRYRVLKLLGQGGMGLVFLAEDPRLQRQVALKIMRPELAQNPTIRMRFLREARAIATIHSDHVVTIHEIGEVNDLPYLTAEHLVGKPLDAWLMQGHHPKPGQVLNLGLQIAWGLEAAHQCGVIHRDIKPANIWVEEPSGRIKIIDFGLARTGDGEADLTHAGTILGTPAYMAPEQADGSRLDERCDLFGLGCVLYEVAAGDRPFDGSSPFAVVRAVTQKEPAPLRKLNPGLPPALSNLVMQLLAKSPEDRPASAAAVVEALEAISDTLAIAPLTAKSPTTRRVPTIPRATEGRGFRVPYLAGLAGLLSLSFLFALALLPALLRGGTGPISPGGPAKEETANAHPAHSSTARGVSDDEILLGMSAPFSGPARELGRNMEVGVQTYFSYANDEGGIAGRKLRLVVLDDGYEPDRALANMKELYEQRQVFACVGNVGTPTAEKTMPYALSKQMIFFGAYTGAPLLRKDPPDRYVFNYRASYEEETTAIVKYLVEIKAIRPEEIAVLAQQDGYGDAGFNGVVKSLRKYGRRPEDILRVGHPRNSVEVGDAVQEVLRHKEIRAIVMVSTYRPATQFIRRVKDAKADLLFANVSFVGDELAEELLQMGPDYAAGVMVTQVVPHPDSQSSAALKYRELLGKYYPNEQPGFGSLEGYIDAAVLAESLRRVGRNLTTETLVDALEATDGLDLGLGAALRYGPSEHQASHKVWGTVLDRSGHYQILELE